MTAATVNRDRRAVLERARELARLDALIRRAAEGRPPPAPVPLHVLGRRRESITKEVSAQ